MLNRQVRFAADCRYPRGGPHIPKVPNAEVRRSYSITSSALASSDCGMARPNALAAR